MPRWLNQVVPCFALLTDNLDPGHPKPFAWTKTADEILDRLASHQQFPGAGHLCHHELSWLNACPARAHCISGCRAGADRLIAQARTATGRRQLRLAFLITKNPSETTSYRTGSMFPRCRASAAMIARVSTGRDVSPATVMGPV